ncbi:unnamed protein product, partial [Staurois parvus]
HHNARNGEEALALALWAMKDNHARIYVQQGPEGWGECCELECPLHWWAVRRMLLPFVVSEKNAHSISGQWEECCFHL